MSETRESFCSTTEFQSVTTAKIENVGPTFSNLNPFLLRSSAGENIPGYERNVMVYFSHVRHSTFKSQQYAGCLSDEPSLMALAPTSLLQLSGRASELVIGRSQVRLLIGALGFLFSEYACVTFQNNHHFLFFFFFLIPGQSKFLHSDSLELKFWSLYLGCYHQNSVFSIFNVLLKQRDTVPLNIYV